MVVNHCFKERAWYDSHREQILRGGLGEKLEEDGIDLFQYFSSSCYSGQFVFSINSKLKDFISFF